MNGVLVRKQHGGCGIDQPRLRRGKPRTCAACGGMSPMTGIEAASAAMSADKINRMDRMVRVPWSRWTADAALLRLPSRERDTLQARLRISRPLLRAACAARRGRPLSTFVQIRADSWTNFGPFFRPNRPAEPYYGMVRFRNLLEHEHIDPELLCTQAITWLANAVSVR